MSDKSLIKGKMTGKKITSLQTRVPENNVCMVCNEEAPMYICMTFRTFVCQACSDVHCACGHSVMSMLHSEWTAEQLELVESGGNKKAAQEWLAFWNATDFPRPGKGDPDRISDFVRKAFVVKCWQRQPKRTRKTPSLAPMAPAHCTTLNDAPVLVPMEQQHTDWAQFPAPPFQVVPGPPPGQFMPPSAACFCPQHDSSFKRPKQQQPTCATCQGCKLLLTTTYCHLTFCPQCSALRRACMICGAPGGFAGPAAMGKPEEAQGKPLSLECSDRSSTSTEAAGACAGEGDARWKADFSSGSDGEAVDVVAAERGFPVQVAAAVAATATAVGCLLDLDFGAPSASAAGVHAAVAEAPVAAPAPAAAPELGGLELVLLRDGGREVMPTVAALRPAPEPQLQGGPAGHMQGVGLDLVRGPAGTCEWREAAASNSPPVEHSGQATGSSGPLAELEGVVFTATCAEAPQCGALSQPQQSASRGAPVVSQEQLDGMDTQSLAQLHLMVLRTLQQRPGVQFPPPLVPAASSAAVPAAGAPSGVSAAKAREDSSFMPDAWINSSSPRKSAFGEVMEVFQARHALAVRQGGA